jgi:hypothetical protein
MLCNWNLSCTEKYAWNLEQGISKEDNPDFINNGVEIYQADI